MMNDAVSPPPTKTKIDSLSIFDLIQFFYRRNSLPRDRTMFLGPVLFCGFLAIFRTVCAGKVLDVLLVPGPRRAIPSLHWWAVSSVRDVFCRLLLQWWRSWPGRLQRPRRTLLGVPCGNRLQRQQSLFCWLLLHGRRCGSGRLQRTGRII